ncbi:glucose-6-phosphate dehydrogenase [Sneathiella chinensis]|uniref:Glucose-6-phosphate 1-dehydrogenase n=1 Tax=Sneathiella chinensis TaxID=349750 RepID=A0ABQ5U4C6_9PROT|nr:glucose-6-phosphate dehydrogenase [Sneathiella chinensis]GLQ06129.1 glucose-6-phosphate 1-dehydrogenase [Sneathiella chinensis]
MSIALGVKPFEFVVFGGTGDLAIRKLMPALLFSECDKRLPEESDIIALGRSDLSRDDYIAMVRAGCVKHMADYPFSDADWDAFSRRLSYLQLDADNGHDFLKLKEILDRRRDRVRVFYLATHSDLFGKIGDQLHAAGVITDETRIVLEKPLGMDLATAKQVNEQIGRNFREDQIFRIDHYLGKETVQNLMVLRFGNSLFEPVWHHGMIDSVQITVAETIGVEGRGDYYDKSGALRDMMQNHLMQLLCLVAMEPPAHFDQDDVRDEKLKVLKSLRPLSDADVADKTVRGQYEPGAIGGLATPGYLDDLAIGESQTETFAALKAEVENWRWTGVPFYLRTGKRLRRKFSEIVIQFKPVPHPIFNQAARGIKANRLIIRLQPDEGIKLIMTSKVPGPGGIRLQQTPLNLSFSDVFRSRSPEAYERLILDAVRGNSTLFMRRDELEASWAWIEPILDAWQEDQVELSPYQGGTMGPNASTALMARDNRTWHDGEET